MSDREKELKQVCRHALADLEGIMPEYDPEQKHPAWQTIKELKIVLREYAVVEFIIPLVDGRTLCCPASFDACEYVRICDQDSQELNYWYFEEFERAPKVVLGALMAAIGNPPDEEEKSD